MKTFKQKVVQGHYKTQQEFLDGFTNTMTDWYNYPHKISREEHLDITFNELSILLNNPVNAYLKFLQGDLFYIPTYEEIKELWAKYVADTANPLRFGQFVYNEIQFEYTNSYFIQDKVDAFNMLNAGIYHYKENPCQ